MFSWAQLTHNELHNSWETFDYFPNYPHNSCFGGGRVGFGLPKAAVVPIPEKKPIPGFWWSQLTEEMEALEGQLGTCSIKTFIYCSSSAVGGLISCSLTGKGTPRLPSNGKRGGGTINRNNPHLSPAIHGIWGCLCADTTQGLCWSVREQLQAAFLCQLETSACSSSRKSY